MTKTIKKASISEMEPIVKDAKKHREWMLKNMNLRKALSKDYIKFEVLADTLESAFLGNMNVVFYGPGGYGKSTMVVDALKAIGVTPETGLYVKSLNSGTTTEDIIGVMDMKKFMDDSELEYNTVASFMNYPFVVLEEGFDARSKIMGVLKDILESGYFRNGSQLVPIKTRCVIILTNHPPSEYADDQSIEALLQRFPLRQEIVWDTHTSQDYMDMFAKKSALDHNDRMLCELIALSGDQGTIVPPRVARQARKLFKTNFELGKARNLKENKCKMNAFTSLSQLEAISPGVVEDFKRNLHEIEEGAKQTEYVKKIEDYVTPIIEKQVTGVVGNSVKAKTLENLVNQMGRIHVNERSYPMLQDIIEKAKAEADNCRNEILRVTRIEKIRLPDFD